MNRVKMKRIAGKTVAYTILILLGTAFALPLIWLILAAFDSRAVSTISAIEEFTLDNFMAVIQNKSYMYGFANSFMYSAAVVVIVLLCTLFAAYPLSRYNFKAATRISLSMLFLSSVPATALIVPIYRMFLSMKLLDKPIGLILFMSATGLPYSIWMMKNFLDAVPKELEEAAWVDGASSVQCLFRIIVPLMIPGIITVGVYRFIGVWSNFIIPYILLTRPDSMPASVLIYTLFGGSRGEVTYGVLAAFSIMYMAPVVILNSLAQNYMSKGFTMSGANKG